MVKKTRGLGRGLDALLGARVAGERTEEIEAAEGLRQLPIERIQRGRFQPRTDIRPESLKELVESIKAQGVIQPIVVRALDDERYELIAGERRWRASQLAGLETIPALVREVSDRIILAIALIENVQREDLNPLEEAGAYERLLKEFQMTHAEVAEAVGKSRATITNILRLLDLNEAVRRLLERGELEMGHARALLGLPGEEQRQAATTVVARGLSVRETEALARRLRSARPAPQSAATVDPDVLRLQEDLSGRIGARVRIRQRSTGRGTLSIEYDNLDQLEGILAHIH